MKKLSPILFKFIVTYFIFINSAYTDTRFVSYPLNSIIVVDGDTIKTFSDVKIRLEGIDAPEMKQICENKFKSPYACGEVAKSRLESILDKRSNPPGKRIYCYYSEVDRYKRLIAECFLGKDSSFNINKYMVRNGLAVAYLKYSKKYLNTQELAKKGKMGIWQGTFIMPEEWRRKNK